MKSSTICIDRALMQCAFAESKQPEITGTVSFNIMSRCGRIENLSVQNSDGETGKYKAILAGDSGLPGGDARTVLSGHR